jgi:hypothetical protein
MERLVGFFENEIRLLEESERVHFVDFMNGKKVEILSQMLLAFSSSLPKEMKEKLEENIKNFKK